MEKVHVLIQKAVKDEQAVGPGRQSGGGSEVGVLSSHRGSSSQRPSPAPGQWWNRKPGRVAGVSGRPPRFLLGKEGRRVCVAMCEKP